MSSYYVSLPPTRRQRRNKNTTPPSTRWNTSDRRSRLPDNWKSIRQTVLRRDGGACVWVMSDESLCGYPANQVDHIRRGDDHSLENLQSLCEWHHNQKSSREGHEAMAERREKAKLAEKMKHPGMKPLTE